MTPVLGTHDGPWEALTPWSILYSLAHRTPVQSTCTLYQGLSFSMCDPYAPRKFLSDHSLSVSKSSTYDNNHKNNSLVCI